MHNLTQELNQLLQDAWSFENRLLETLEHQKPLCEDLAGLQLHSELVRQTQAQRTRLVQRLKDLGLHPEGYVGTYTGRLIRMALEVANCEDEKNRGTQFLITSYGIQQLGLRMTRDLLRAAQACGDTKTMQVLRSQREEVEASARRLLYCIGLATRGKAA